MEKYLINKEYYLVPKKFFWNEVAKLKEFTPNYHSNYLIFPEGEKNMEGVFTVDGVSRKVWVGKKE